ncbi:MAG: polymer-forming cytoskeletal protein [Desulfobacteraceae bacterium]|nr:polymer-forming cytoskeletal protein [Desulfobacteraceae bacterium]
MNKTNLSIIDKELTIEGSISSTGKLIIKGKVNGEIKGDVIVIAEDGEVDSSSAIVSSMTVGGKFNGDVIASKELIILSTGSCSGKVECKDLIVENGGVLNAEVSCTTSSQVDRGKEKEKIRLAKKEMKESKKIEL